MTAIVKLAILAAVLVFWVLRLLQLGKTLSNESRFRNRFACIYGGLFGRSRRGREARAVYPKGATAPAKAGSD
jgi:type II secretory pathway component PulL